MTFWDAKDAAEKGRVRRVRRAIWLDRWHHYDVALWYRSAFNRKTGAFGPARVVEAADLSLNDIRAKDWTFDPIPEIASSLVQSLSIEVKGQFDGSDFVCIKGQSIWFERRNWLPPVDLFVRVNEGDWYPLIPEWYFEERAEWTYVEVSQVFPLPDDGDATGLTLESLEVIEGRELVTVETFPEEGNEFSTRVLIDDDETGGDGPYHIRLNFEV
jgi:hypothetical protein